MYSLKIQTWVPSAWTSLIALTVLAACSQAPEQQSDVVAFEGATLIVGDGSAPIANAVFTVAGGAFLAVGTGEEVEIPAGATRVDLTGMTVMPAIVDAHTHLSTTRAALLEDLEKRAYYGVGAALSLGADGEGAPLEVRDETITGAARYLSAGRGITAPEPGRSEVPHWVTTETEARQAVSAEADRGVDIIKIWVDDRDGQFEKLSPALYSAVIDEAHQRGLKVAAHIFALEDAKELLRSGIDVFAHGVRDRDIDDEFVAMARERPNVVLIPNLPSRGVATDLSWLAGSMPAGEMASIVAANGDRPEIRAAFGIQSRNLRRLNAAGMTIAFGTDGNTPWGPHVEMEDMTLSGMTPAEVIVAATSHSAAAIGLTDTGSIVAGKSADFIVLEANPLDDIRNTRRIVSTYLRGDMVDRAGLAARWTAVSTN